MVIADIADDAAQQVATAIAAETGRRTLWAHGDVTDAAQIEALCQRVAAEWGRLDIAVSNAGILFAGALTEIEPARWRR